MAINFPFPASAGTKHTEAGLTWVYDGVKWTTESTPIDLPWTRDAATDTINPTTAGDDVTADNATFAGDATMTSQNDGPLAGFRNHIINGNAVVWQRGLAVSGQGFGSDRWEMSVGNTRTLQKSNGSSFTPNAPSPYLFGWEATSGTTMTQAVELMRTGEMAPFLPGTTWTFSFYWSGTTLPGVAFSFNDGSGDFNAGDIIVADGTSTSLGESRYSYTFTIPSNQTIASTRTNFGVRFIKKSSSDDFITCVQFEPGPVATPFENRPIAAELALCQRYFVSWGSRTFNLNMYKHGNTDARILYLPNPVFMRADPTATVGSVNVLSGFTADAYKEALILAGLNTSSTDASYVGSITLDAEL